MIQEEKTVSRETVFQGKIVTLHLDRVQMPNGTMAERELVAHPGGVGVVALTPDDKVIMVRQFRKPLEKVIWEIPAGKLDPGEEPETCGRRELEEETGYRAKSFVSLGYMYPSPGFTDEVTHIYLARELYRGESHPDPDEYLDVVAVPFSEILEKVMQNEINDAKTVAGILKAWHIIQSGDLRR